jgi:hypothetical protein
MIQPPQPDPDGARRAISLSNLLREGLDSPRKPDKKLPAWLANVEWSASVLGTSLEDDREIKAILLDSASKYWTSPELAENIEGFHALSSADAMRFAFNATAQFLFDRGLLLSDRLDAISLLVWESARMGGWLRITPEMRSAFGKQLGHDGVWSDQDALFRAETASWRGRLLRTPLQPGKDSAPRRERRGDPRMQRIVQKVKRLRATGLSDKELYRELGDGPRPPRVGWRDMTWPAAYLNHTATVAKWLSKACAS